MMSTRQRLLMVELAAVAAPVVLMLVGRTLLADPAPSATALQVSGPILPAVPAVPAKPLSPEQLSAAAWLRLMPESMQLVSPLNHPSDVPVVRPVLPEQPTPVQTSPVRNLKLSAVLGTDGDQLAMISGKIYRVGDEVLPGLTLSSIDARISRITLTDSEGTVYEIKRDR